MPKGVFIRSEEHRQKMKISSRKGADKIRGVKRPPRTKEHMQKILNSRKKYLGTANPFWKGGYEDYWKKQAKIRDDYTCQVCGLREPEIMEADHIISKQRRPDLIKEMSNLITLCPNCHRRKTIREKDYLKIN